MRFIGSTFILLNLFLRLKHNHQEQAFCLALCDEKMLPMRLEVVSKNKRSI